MILYLRLLLILALLAFCVWFLRRLYLAAARNPRLRYTLASMGPQLLRGLLLRGLLLRYLLPYLFRAFRFLRFFR
ncbi:MAG: hypothetical protein V3S29_04170 [bacterium]